MGDTFGDVVDYAVDLVTALKVCNAQLTSIRAIEAARCEL